MINNVAEYLHESAKKYPKKVAFKDEQKEITFSELDKKAGDIASVIHAMLGDIKNEPIAVYMEKSVDCLTAFMGVVYSGNYYSPIDIHSPKERIEIVLNVLQPVLIIAHGASRKNFDLGQFSAFNEKIIYLEDINPTSYNIDTVLKKILDIDPLYVLFTSGSTGVPKGVVICHRAVIDYAEWLTKTFKFSEHTVFGEQAPFYFDNSILDIYSTLRNGATLIIIPEKLFSFQVNLLEYLNKYQVNTIFWVPSALISVANTDALERVELKTLEKVLFCGEVMPTKPLNIWKKYYPNFLYANLYGPTEITDVCTYYIVDREFDDAESVPIGKACENMEVIILNEKDQLAQIGEVGELCVRGIGLSLGYYGQRDKTKEVFIQNPLNTRYRDLIYRTGDVVKMNDRGEIIYLCRKDSQIKYLGHRIELGEIDSAGYSIQGIRQACAIYDGSQIVFYCATDSTLSEKEIYAHLKQKIPKYMLPRVINIMKSLPLNLNGKIDRVFLNQLARKKKD